MLKNENKINKLSYYFIVEILFQYSIILITFFWERDPLGVNHLSVIQRRGDFLDNPREEYWKLYEVQNSNFEIFKLLNFQNLKIIKMDEIIEKRNKDIYMNQISKI